MHEKRIEIRWRDQDGYAHVNQAVYQTYVEEAVDDWLRGVLGIEEGEVWHYVAARFAIDYRSELRLSDRIALARCRPERIGTSSVTVRTDVHAPDGRLVAEAESVLVARDPETGSSRPLAEGERAALLAYPAASTPDSSRSTASTSPG
ncbi:MAG: acyl-CoA thioesterase [Actinobacteria bacterium]|nr:acyl-CoA thioesterase [Actinomycetota bacterium]